MKNNLNDKVVFLTGSTGGIGSAIAKSLAETECTLIIHGRDEEKLKKLKNELQVSSKNEVVTCVFDLCDFQSCKNALEKISFISDRINVLINNAGKGAALTQFQEFEQSNLERIIQVNLTGLLQLTRLLIPTIIKNQNSHVVNIGSAGGKWAHPRNLPYIAAKSGLLAATEALRIDLMGLGVRVSIIEPGLVRTKLSQVTRLSKSNAISYAYGNSELLLPEDIADAVIWCLTRPPRVNVQEMVIFPTDQPAIGYLYRGKKI